MTRKIQFYKGKYKHKNAQLCTRLEDLFFNLLPFFSATVLLKKHVLSRPMHFAVSQGSTVIFMPLESREVESSIRKIAQSGHYWLPGVSDHATRY